MRRDMQWRWSKQRICQKRSGSGARKRGWEEACRLFSGRRRKRFARWTRFPLRWRKEKCLLSSALTGRERALPSRCWQGFSIRTAAGQECWGLILSKNESSLPIRSAPCSGKRNNSGRIWRLMTISGSLGRFMTYRAERSKSVLGSLQRSLRFQAFSIRRWEIFLWDSGSAVRLQPPWSINRRFCFWMSPP